MFKNLLSNAIKYSHHNNEILIELLQKNNFLTLRIVNIGDGLSDEEIQKLFDNFYRAKNSKNPRITGSGLGLAIVKKIIDLHNNEIIFTSFLNQNCVQLVIKF